MKPESKKQLPDSNMDSFSILCDEFSRLQTEKQDEEIGKLFVLVGGIRITRKRNESDEDFRSRTFEMGLEKLPDGYEYDYATEFFENRIIPSLIDDFKASSAAKQERLMDKLSELTDGHSIKRKHGESERLFRIRCYSRLLRKLQPGSESEMVEFARLEDDSDEESDHESDDHDSDEDSYDDSTSTRSDRFNRRGKLKSKGMGRSDTQ